MQVLDTAVPQSLALVKPQQLQITPGMVHYIAFPGLIVDVQYLLRTHRHTSAAARTSILVYLNYFGRFHLHLLSADPVQYMSLT
jgi:hypothetical protein